MDNWYLKLDEMSAQRQGELATLTLTFLHAGPLPPVDVPNGKRLDRVARKIVKPVSVHLDTLLAAALAMRKEQRP